jgi:Transposase IS4
VRCTLCDTEVVEDNTICFVWQDNKPVIAISTAHSLHRPEDRIQRLRRCPKISFKNARILTPVFQGLLFKNLFIPKAINDYNHHMKGVDQADALRASFTSHRKQNYRTWVPLFYFLVDLACVNAFLLWKWSSTANLTYDSRTHNGHRAFMNALCTQLLESNKNGPRMKEPSSIPSKGLDIGHEHIQKESLGRCE